jgi:hypothetical protein
MSGANTLPGNPNEQYQQQEEGPDFPDDDIPF